MAGDFGSTSLDPQSVGQNVFDGRRLEPFQPQPLDALREQPGGGLEGVGSGSEGLDPMQPMADFTARWQDGDGNWIGDPAQRYQDYLSALTESRNLSVNTMLGVFDEAAANPPWANPTGGSVLDGTSISDHFVVAEPTSEIPPGCWPESTLDGGRVFVSGLDPHWQADKLDSVQGDNVQGFGGTCGLASVENVARQFGIPVTESQVVEFAAKNGLCDAKSLDPTQNGGTTPYQQAELLRDMGIPAHAGQGDLGSLAEAVDQGRGVIIGVNSDELWGQRSFFVGTGPDHAVTVTGVVRSEDGNVQGYYICDSGRGMTGEFPEDRRRFVSAADMEQCWEKQGGFCVVTDAQRTQGYPPGVFLA